MTNHVIAPDGLVDVPPHPADVLTQAGDALMGLLGELPYPPSVLRIGSGPVSVEIELPAISRPVPAERVTPAPAQALSGDPRTDAAPGGGPPQAEASSITSPNVGRFHEAAKPGGEPLVRAGDQVSRGQRIGVIETVNIRIPIEADQDGEIVDVLKADGETVEYGTPLFALAATP